MPFLSQIGSYYVCVGAVGTVTLGHTARLVVISEQFDSRKCTHVDNLSLCTCHVRLLGTSELHCPKCRVVTTLRSGGVIHLPINYALKEVAEALEDEPSPSPPSSLGHTTTRQISGIKHNESGFVVHSINYTLPR